MPPTGRRGVCTWLEDGETRDIASKIPFLRKPPTTGSRLFVFCLSGVKPWYPQSCTTASENEHSGPCMPRGRQYLTPKEMAKVVFIFHANSNPLTEDSEATSELSREEYHDRTVTATVAVGRTASTFAMFAADPQSADFSCSTIPL